MVLFSELCAFGPHIVHAQPVPGEFEQEMCAMARQARHLAAARQHIRAHEERDWTRR
jgi:hypothetical protein